MQDRTSLYLNEALLLKEKILTEYLDILQDSRKKHFIDILNSINKETINAINFRRPSWNSTERLQQLTLTFKKLKECIKMVQKRDYLSITPKIEDIKVVFKWAETFNVPHYYIQVFFDKSYGISFKNILNLITQSEKEGTYYEISQDIKNQNKTTVKINTRKTNQVAYKVLEPEHKSVRREMGRGRLLFYVTFNKGTAYLDVESLKELLEITDF